VPPVAVQPAADLEGVRAMKVCIVGASGKLGQYMVQHALDRGYEVVGGSRGPKAPDVDPWRRPARLLAAIAP
jgi:uncharacterized protein YbjT (DUF2867 family)